MAMKPQTDTRLTLRLPPDLYGWLQDWAAGDRRRPPASLNATILYVLEAGRHTLTQQEPDARYAAKEQ